MNGAGAAIIGPGAESIVCTGAPAMGMGADIIGAPIVAIGAAIAIGAPMPGATPGCLI
jgi:hypothetical protein